MQTAERPPHTPPADHPVTAWAWGPAAVARVVLVAVAAGAVLAGAPTPVTATLSLLAFLVVAERLARLRDRSASDALLVGFGGLLVTPILVGLLLGVSHVGLRPATWALALAAVALVGLVLAESLGPASARRRPAWLRVPSWSEVGWALGVAGALAVALVISVTASNRADVAPVQLSLGQVSASSVRVVVSADRPTGQLELQTEAANGTSLTYPVFTVRPGAPVTTTLVLPTKGRFVITLNNPDQTAPLRKLILDR